MPVKVQKQKGRYRVVERDGSPATSGGKAIDGGGHKTREKAERQARAVNSSMKD